MRQKSIPVKDPAARVVKDIRRAMRRHFTAEDKIRIVLEGLRGEDSIAELCRREGIVQNLYYRWSKEFLEAVDWPAIRRGRRPRTRSRSFAVRLPR
jgi:transposase